MKLFLRSVLYFGFYWVEKFDALKKNQREAAVAQIRRTKYSTCLKTVRREQIVRLFAQTSLHTVVSARRTSSTHKSMEMYVGVEQAYPATRLFASGFDRRIFRLCFRNSTNRARLKCVSCSCQPSVGADLSRSHNLSRCIMYCTEIQSLISAPEAMTKRGGVVTHTVTKSIGYQSHPRMGLVIWDPTLPLYCQRRDSNPRCPAV